MILNTEIKDHSNIHKAAYNLIKTKWDGLQHG